MISKSKVNLATSVEGDPKASFSKATTPRCKGGRYSIPGLLYFILDPNLIMLSVKQGGIKYNSSGYHSLSFPFSWAAQPGAWWSSLCWNMVLIPPSYSPTDLNFLSPGLYNNLTPTYFLRASQFRTQFNPSTVKVAPDLLISSTGCTCYLYWCISSFDSLAGVNMQQLNLGLNLGLPAHWRTFNTVG